MILSFPYHARLTEACQKVKRFSVKTLLILRHAKSSWNNEQLTDLAKKMAETFEDVLDEASL